jgi:serine/threonine protein kinase
MSWISDAAVRRLREAAAWPEMPGERYTIARAIGRGGMGMVFEARDEWLGRDVAIKISTAPVPGADLEARLRQEARVLARLEHPGIVPVHDQGLLGDGRLFYVMKLVRGETLEQHAKTIDSAHSRVALFERVAEAVAFAHAAGVVHRDLKPANVMVGSFGEVLVLDWGVAKLLDASSNRYDRYDRDDRSKEPDPRHLPLAVRHPAASVVASAATEAGTRLGTPGFMAPEQSRGDVNAVGPASDVYALGAILYWLFTGRPPPDDPDGARSTLAAVRPTVPKRLRAIAVKCLADEPRLRYADAAALRADITRYRAGGSVSALPETALDRVQRWFATYRTFVLLIAAYLIVRTVIALLGR